MNAVMTNHTYFIKKVVFKGDDSNLIELISVTEEIHENKQGYNTVLPNILASNIREISMYEAKKLGLSINDEEIKVFIDQEKAEYLSSLVNDEDSSEFIRVINSLI